MGSLFSSSRKFALTPFFPNSVYFLGDSFARHIVTALDIILHDRLDGGVVDYLTTTDCRGEAMFVLLLPFFCPPLVSASPIDYSISIIDVARA